MCILPFESTFGCFKDVVSYLSCICFFGAIWFFSRVDLAFFAFDCLYLATLSYSCVQWSRMLKTSPSGAVSVVYGYGNFAILIQSEAFSSTPYPIHIQKYKIMDSDIQSNPKLLNQLHISQYNWYCLFCLTRQNLWLFCLLSDKSCWSDHTTSRLRCTKDKGKGVRLR